MLLTLLFLTCAGWSGGCYGFAGTLWYKVVGFLVERDGAFYCVSNYYFFIRDSCMG